MTLQELRFIVALAREKHFHKASQACFVSQPTLSIAVQKLEKELNVTLFERHKNELRVTDVGKDIVERAKRILAEADEIKQLATLDKNHLHTPLKLGAIYTVGSYLLPELITTLNKLAPEMPIEIHEDFTVNLRNKLNSGELDAILISLPFTATGIVTRELYREPFVVLMPSDHPLTKFKSISEDALSDYNVLMLGEGHCFRDQVMASCPDCFAIRKSGAGFNWRTIEGGSLETIRHMVAAKMGLTILPATAAWMGPYNESTLTTRPLKSTSPHRVVALAWRQSFPRFKAIEMVLKAVSKCELEGAKIL
jgi:LysR family hydrogen peroxide-inducible transcriptional activator